MSNFKEYYKIFSKEDICIRILKEIREQQGIICKKCGNKNHYWKNDKKKYECKECNYRTSLKTGTVMENSNLPLQYWMSAIAYLSAKGGNISALKLQKELKHNRYEPILRLMKKIKCLPESDILKQKLIQYISGVNTLDLLNKENGND
jgi:transposase-like protein